MKKEDFVKLGVPEELAVKCENASSEELKGFIPKTRFDKVNSEKKNLEASVSERDKQLEELKKSSGDNAELKKQIEALRQQNAEQQKAHATELAQIKLDNAVDTALTAAGAKNIKALKPFIDIEKVKLDSEGKLTGLDEQLEAVRKSDGYLFAENQPCRLSFEKNPVVSVPETAGKSDGTLRHGGAANSFEKAQIGSGNPNKEQVSAFVGFLSIQHNGKSKAITPRVLEEELKKFLGECMSD